MKVCNASPYIIPWFIWTHYQWCLQWIIRCLGSFNIENMLSDDPKEINGGSILCTVSTTADSTVLSRAHTTTVLRQPLIDPQPNFDLLYSGPSDTKYAKKKLIKDLIWKPSCTPPRWYHPPLAFHCFDIAPLAQRISFVFFKRSSQGIENSNKILWLDTLENNTESSHRDADVLVSGDFSCFFKSTQRLILLTKVKSSLLTIQ